MNRDLLRRSACALLVLAAMALPAAAQPVREPGANALERLASSFWQRLGAPLLSLWEKGRITIDPNGAAGPAPDSAAPAPDTDGRGTIDPNG